MILTVCLAVLLPAWPAPAAGEASATAAPPAHGTAVGSGELVEHPRAWDGHPVVFTGEAVGERMERAGGCWIHLNDDAYMLRNIEEGASLGGYNSGHAVWLPVELGRRITFFGDYRHEGDVVRVTGIFHAACREHGGDMDIHASALDVVRPGHPVKHTLHRGRAALAALLLLAAAGLWALRRRAERRRT